jgi:hypothetical protein
VLIAVAEVCIKSKFDDNWEALSEAVRARRDARNLSTKLCVVIHTAIEMTASPTRLDNRMMLPSWTRMGMRIVGATALLVGDSAGRAASRWLSLIKPC